MLKGQARYQGLAEIQAETQANDTPIQICIVLFMQVLVYVAVISVAMRIVATRLRALQN
jgi:hypothetical protein